MGMAASQARLLSITSRMSDNELRAQLINNAKMRLTSDSARVSDEYIAALNQTQLMFTNYDLAGNEQYQNLTFNSLTAYSSYNNQYGIVNGAGELLVSALDAENFEKAGNLEGFLGMYGLTKDTTYFETNKLDTVGYYDDYGAWQDLGVTMADMQAIYEGRVDANGIDHYGYDASMNSAEFSAYKNLVTNYRTAKEAYKSSINDQLNKFMNGELEISGKKLQAGGKKFETLYEEVNKLTLNADGSFDHAVLGQYRDYMKDLMGQLGITLTDIPADLSETTSNFLTEESSTFINGIESNFALCNPDKIGTAVKTYSYQPKTYGYAVVDEEGNIINTITSADIGSIYVKDEEDPILVGGEKEYIDGIGSKWIYGTYVADADQYNKLTLPELPPNQSYQKLYYYESTSDNYDYTEVVDGVTKYYKYATLDTYQGDKSALKEYVISDTPCINIRESRFDDGDALASLKYMYEYFKNNAKVNINEQIFVQQDAFAKGKYNEYKKAAKELATFIYGSENAALISPKYYDYLDDPSWVLSQNHMYPETTIKYTKHQKDPTTGEDITYEDTVTTTEVDKTHYNPYSFPTTTPPPTEMVVDGVTYPVNYQVVKDLFLLECMFEHYGEPNYTWIDETNPDENAEAKAQWYTNLYERMSEGYKVLPENLQDSQEWLQFAFESGLVHMEQVDKSNAWVSTMYSNCSNIKESTVDVDVTVAEAKYNREMNKIEAKDKQYDIELKNIDTEHSSLQTEYDSIKSVIDKNVERNFKMFQA